MPASFTDSSTSLLDSLDQDRITEQLTTKSHWNEGLILLFLLLEHIFCKNDLTHQKELILLYLIRSRSLRIIMINNENTSLLNRVLQL